MKYFTYLKSILLLLLISISLSCSKNIDNTLIAFYPFNGNAIDESGNGNNCEIQAALLITNRFGETNSAYYFNGVNAVIYGKVKNMPALNTPLSISWWFLIEELQTYKESFGAGNMFALVNNQEACGVQAGFRGLEYKTLGFDVWKKGGGTLLEAEIPNINTWHHCCYSFDGLIHRFYLDGKEISNSKNPQTNGTPNELVFGNYPSGNQFYKGKLDDIYIYNRVLTPKEINKLHLN